MIYFLLGLFCGISTSVFFHHYPIKAELENLKAKLDTIIRKSL